MQALIWIGAAFTLMGVLGLGYCVARVLRAKRAGLDDATLQAELRRVVAINLGAIGVSTLGLMLVVVGVLLS